MDIKILVAIIMIVLFFAYFIYELIKENHKTIREKRRAEEQIQFFDKIGSQLLENSNINQEILKFLKFSCQKYTEEITESQARIVINSVLENSQNDLLKYLTKIVNENHIKGNEKEIITKTKLFISNRIHKDFLALKEFKYKEKTIGDIQTNDWREYITENVLEHILKGKGEKPLSGTLRNCYDSLEYDVFEAMMKG